MFTDSSRKRYNPVHFRSSNPENVNKQMNYHTKARVFLDTNAPQTRRAAPILDVNIAGNRPKDVFKTYKEDNIGIVRN